MRAHPYMAFPLASHPEIDVVDVLTFEQAWGRRRADTKNIAIRTRFGISPTLYYLALNKALDSDVVAARHPEVVAELLERRTTRHERRRGRA